MFKNRNKRETGFEILRILAMFFIMLVHILNAGGMLANANNNTILWHKLLYSFFTPAVNVFVLVSAYFMVTSKIKFKKLLNLWCQVVFYCVASYLIFSLVINNNFSLKILICCFFPIVRNKYWFFTSYFILMLLSPFLNKMLNNASKKELYGLSALLFILSYLYMKQPIGDVFNLGLGYSVWWFICLYVFAGTLRLYPINIKKGYVLIIYLASIFFLWIFSMLQTTNYGFNLIWNSLDYTSPLVIISSISLLILFKGVNIKNLYVHNIICYVSTLTFGAYLLDCSYLSEFFRFNIFKLNNYYTSHISPLYVLLIALGTLVCYFIIEAIRKSVVMLFRKLIQGNK